MMKFHRGALSVVWASSLVTTLPSVIVPAQAWIPHAQRVSRPIARGVLSVSSGTSRAYSWLTATVLADDNVSSSSNADGRSGTTQPALGHEIAQGTIVSAFPGGLTAVHIDDSWTSTDEADAVPSSVEAVSVATPKVSKPVTVTAAGDLLGMHVGFPNGSVGVVVAHRPPVVFVYNDDDLASKDGPVKVFDSRATVTLSEQAKVVDVFGRYAVKGEESTSNDQKLEKGAKERVMFAPIPQVKDIALINTPMLTGITMVDALAPIGRGQNMLVIGHDVHDMRGLATDFLQTQLRDNAGVQCVYAAIQDPKDVQQRLQRAGLDDQVHVVIPTLRAKGKDPASKAAEAVAMAGTACAIAESYALDQGKHAVVVIDTIDLHKTLWDATTRVLVDVFGVDAVVEGDRNGAASSEMRAFYSSLIQRAGQYNQRRGGGSVTLVLLTSIPPANADETTVFEETEFASSNDKVKTRIQMLVSKKIPLTVANLQKIGIPIPSASEGQRRLVLQHVDDLISMSDGQIWFDERLQAAGQSPPMDPQRSVTRIGIGADTPSRADAPALRRIVERLRLDLSQAASMDGADVTSKASQSQIRKQQALLLAMYQPAGAGGRRLSESCTAVLAASEGYLDQAVDHGALAGTQQGRDVVQALLEHVNAVSPATMREIDSSLDINTETRRDLTDAIASHF